MHKHYYDETNSCFECGAIKEMKLIDVILDKAKLCQGRYRVIELIQSKAVKVNGDIITNPDQVFQKGETLEIKIGKRREGVVTI